MPAQQRNISPAILKEAHALLTTYFKSNLTISSVQILSEPERRNGLLRLTLESKTSSLIKSVILKQYVAEKNPQGDQEAFNRCARDWSAHLFLEALGEKEPLVPKLYGGSVEQRFIILEDLGQEHVSLVDALTSSNKQEAKSALERYTIQMAKLHGLAHLNFKNYNLIFNKFKSVNTLENNGYDNAIREIVPVLNNLGIILNSDMKSEIKRVLKILKEPSEFTTLIHGDLCPDNVFDDPQNNKLRIIDFEWSSLSNALLDGVYIRMNMPTCWCAKAFPEELILELELVYQQELAKNIPAASDNKLYRESYSAACAYWMLWNITAINEIWDKDSDLSNPQFHKLHKNWRPEYQLRRPRVLSRLEAFIKISHQYDSLPHLREMATLVLNQLQRIWPGVNPMGLYRAFL